MEASGRSCILELNSLKCMVSMIAMKGKEISHTNMGLCFNLEANYIASFYSLLSDPLKMVPPIFQETRKYRDIKHDIGKPEPSPQPHVNINVSTVVSPTEEYSQS